MKKIARFLFGNFTILEWCLWLFSVTTIVVLFLAFGAGGTLSLIASLIGATSLIFIAKGNVVGQALTIVFSVLYGIVSYQTAYDGAHRCPSTGLVVASPLKRRPLSRRSEAPARARVAIPLTSRRRRYSPLLFYSKMVRHRQSSLRHRFCIHQFCCCLSGRASMPALRTGIRRK